MPAEPSVTTARGRPFATSRESVAQVALALFEERGFEKTTVDDIAAKLGVGRRTVFRYYASKNDIVWGDFNTVLRRHEHDLDAQGDGVPLINAIAAAAVASNRYPPEQLSELRTRMTLITTVPALQAHSMLRYADWRSVIARYASRRLHEQPEDLASQTIAFVSLGTCMAAFSHWVRFGGDLEQHLADGFGLLASGFRR
jgi:mycofactocin system transcriptional regulator